MIKLVKVQEDLSSALIEVDGMDMRVKVGTVVQGLTVTDIEEYIDGVPTVWFRGGWFIDKRTSLVASFKQTFGEYESANE